MSMDVGQLMQMTTWLDEEHRRDKAELIRLQQRVESQEGELKDQARLIQDLEGRVAGLQAQLLRFAQYDASLAQLKEEVVQMFAQADERRQQEAREAERVRAIERDNTARAVNELRRDAQRLPRVDEELALRKAEQRRMADSILALQQEVSTLGQDVESRLRGMPFLEEGRQQDAKRIARLQQETLEALKRIEEHASRLQRLEDVGQRQERDTGEVKALVSQVRASQREFIDGQLLEAEQLKRHTSEWFEALTVALKKVDEFSARLQEFGDAFQEDRQVVESVERFQERISREQTQVAELQRLAEERQKRQLEQWQDENEKRWRKELLRWDHQWAEQSKRNGQTGDHFLEVEKNLQQHRAQIDGMWKFLEARISYETQESRRWLAEMTRLLEDRPKKE
jgi:hypothetical protein